MRFMPRGQWDADRPALSFLPGEAIDDYLYIPFAVRKMPVDVHGNQVQLLKEKPLLSVDHDDDLHDLPRCPQAAAWTRRRSRRTV